MSEISQTPGIKDIIGTFQTIKPSALLNRDRLFTTQSWIDLVKLRNALDGNPKIEDEPPQAWVFTDKKGKVAYVIGDGNHRIALTAISGGEIEVKIAGGWDPERKPLGFNVILRQVRSELQSSK